MTNEEIVLEIQRGRSDLVSELWERVSRLAFRMMLAYRQYAERRGVEWEDLQQEAFLAVVAAVDNFDPERGKFSTFLKFAVQRQAAAACGYRSKHGQHEPLNYAASLDAALAADDEGSATLADLIPDPAAERVLTGVLDKTALSPLAEAVQALPDAQRAAIIARYYDEQAFDKRACAAALRTLRHPDISRQFRGLLE